MKCFSFLNQKQYQFLLQQKTVRLLITLPLFKIVYGFATFIYLLIFFSFFFTINASKKLLSLKNKRQILQSNQIHIFFRHTRIPLLKMTILGFTDTRILGYAEAVYDYAATATSQLSLCRGDKVAILSKTGSDKGWWKGEHCISGKVCQNYIQV